MRFKITLHKTENITQVPFNYKHLLSACVYQLLKNADEEYSEFLHNQGYKLSNKTTFKYFCFSDLQFFDNRSYRFQKGNDFMEIIADKIYFEISFYIESAAEKFIIGLFQNQKLSIRNKYYAANFIVETIETLQEPNFELGKSTFSTLSPIVIGRKNERGNDDYLIPTDPDFERFLQENLLKKFMAIRGSLPPEWAKIAWNFKLLTEPRKRKTAIKENRNDGTEIVGYLFDFELTAPAELLQLAYHAGLGRFNAEGMGMVRVRNED